MIILRLPTNVEDIRPFSNLIFDRAKLTLLIVSLEARLLYI